MLRGAVACLLAACASERPAGDTTATAAAPVASPTPRDAWAVTAHGIGPLRAGMTRAEAERAVGGAMATRGDSAWGSCAYATSAKLPAGVRVMVEQGTVARVDVDSGAVATAEGARIGDPEARILELYRGHVVTAPAKYGGGHVLTATPPGAADKAFRIVFETNGARVTKYRAGRVPAVEYVEGCG